MLGASFEATNGFLDGSLLGLLFGRPRGNLANEDCYCLKQWLPKACLSILKVGEE